MSSGFVKLTIAIQSFAKRDRILLLIRFIGLLNKATKPVIAGIRQLNQDNIISIKVLIDRPIESHHMQHTAGWPEQGFYSHPNCILFRLVEVRISPTDFHVFGIGKILYRWPKAVIHILVSEDNPGMPALIDDINCFDDLIRFRWVERLFCSLAGEIRDKRKDKKKFYKTINPHGLFADCRLTCNSLEKFNSHFSLSFWTSPILQYLKIPRGYVIGNSLSANRHNSATRLN